MRYRVVVVEVLKVLSNLLFSTNHIIFIDVAECEVLSTAYIPLQKIHLSFQFQVSKT